MGRIKTQQIKRLTYKLLEEYRADFAKDFEENKVAVQKHVEPINKKLRNVVAGYITRLMRTDEMM